MKLFSKSMLAAALLAGVSVSAETYSYAKTADFSKVKKISSDTQEGFQIKTDAAKGRFWLSGTKMIPVEAGKKYKFSCEYRLIPGCTTSYYFLFAANCLDKNKRSIYAAHVLTRPGTLTELAVPAQKGDNTLKVKDASKWNLRHAFAAFNAKADNSDLPNRELSPRITKIEQTGDCWTLTLAKPMKKNYPAGTLVRNHADGISLVYISSHVKPKAEWSSISKVFSGISQNESNGRNFRAGTVFIQPLIFNNSGNVYNIEFRNVKIEEVE